MTSYHEFEVRTQRRAHWVDITDRVQSAVGSCNVKNGICLVSSPHTTAGLTINENADPSVARDFFGKLEKVFPQHDSYEHAEGNSDSHIKAALVGFGVQTPVVDGRLRLGTWQAIYFCEFDGPRTRRVAVSVVGE